MAKDKKTQYVGKAGHLAVMGELALRGYNVAMPEIDYGDDIFVVQDGTARIWRIQVKTATPTKTKFKKPRSERFQLIVGSDFLESKDNNPPVWVVFALRSSKPKDGWRFLVIERKRLAEYYKDNSVGQKQKSDKVKFDISVHHLGKHQGKVLSKCVELTKWLENWEEWGVLPWA